MKIDVLILYENKNREIESLCFLYQEIKKRGYSCKILSIYNPIKYFYKAGVLIVPHLYDDEQLLQFGLNLWRSNTRIISLQWEQIVGKGNNDDDIHNPKGQARYAHHIAWGKAQEKKYLEHGISQNNIWTTGSMSIDLLNSRFNDYFFSKEEVGKRLNIDPNREWVLFISSFSYVNVPKEVLTNWVTMNPNTYEFAEISTKSFNIIVEWIKKAADLFPEKIFLYRPHPAELNNESILSELKKKTNIKIVQDLSMRQWVKVCDRFYNWFSTSLADIYYSNNGCYILRPVNIPERLDIDIFDNIKIINNFEDYIVSLKERKQEQIISPIIDFHYGNEQNVLAIEKIAEIVEKLLNGTIQGYNFKYSQKNWFCILDSGSVLHNLKGWMNIISYYACVIFKIKKIPFFNKKQHRLNVYKTNVYGINKTIRKYNSRIKKFF